MAQQKLYTEEQVFKAIQMADKYHYLLTSDECDIINSLTAIELPSDEEILDEAHAQRAMIFSFTDGAKWMRDKILNK